MCVDACACVGFDELASALATATARMHVGACARVCIWMYVCIYIGMHVCMYVCMYVRLEILIFIYLWCAEVARQAVVADNKLLRIWSGSASRILGTCKHATSSMRRWPDASASAKKAGCDIENRRRPQSAEWKAFGNVKIKRVWGV